MPYRAIALGWHDFFALAGTASATLLGLLFVSLSLHLRAVLAQPQVRGLARATLINFALVLVVALFAVIPEGAESTGIALTVSALVCAASIITPLRATWRTHTRTVPARILVLRFGWSMVGYAGVLAAGILLLSGSSATAFDILLGVVVTLVLISLRNTWDLLIGLGEVAMDTGDKGSK